MLWALNSVPARYAGASSPITTPAPACASSGIKEQPRKLLRSVGATDRRDGGAGSLLRLRRHLLREISRHLGRAWSPTRRADIAATGADTLLAGDLGCLLNIAGRLKREGHPVQVRHVAEVLAGMTGECRRLARAGSSGHVQIIPDTHRLAVHALRDVTLCVGAFQLARHRIGRGAVCRGAPCQWPRRIWLRNSFSRSVCGSSNIRCGVPAFDDFAAVHEHDAVGHLAREAHLVRHADHGHAGTRPARSSRPALP